MKKRNWIKIFIFTLLSLIVSCLLVKVLFEFGLFNFGIQHQINFYQAASDFAIYLATDVLSLIILLLCSIPMIKKISFKGFSITQSQMNHLKKELLFCYTLVLLSFLFGKWIPEFSCLFIPISLIILIPITVFTVLTSHSF